MKPLSGLGVSPQWKYSLNHGGKELGGHLWQHLRQSRHRSRHLLTARLPKVAAELTPKAMTRLLKPRRDALQTVTLDSGSEFSGHETVAKAVTAAIYFFDPYCSSHRGTNENTNGLLRQYFTKGTDFHQVADTEGRPAVKKLNDRPRKRLATATSHRCFQVNTQQPWRQRVLHLLVDSGIVYSLPR